MAATLEGRLLTDAHRVAQVALSGQAVAASRIVWGGLSPTLGNRSTWLAGQVGVVRVFDVRAAGLAAVYLRRFRAVEGNVDGPVVGVSGFDAAWSANVFDAGLSRVAVNIAAGLAPVEAKSRAWGAMSGAVSRMVLQGGRRVVDRSALANPRSVGWRRVADADPCAFCAMLVARGGVFRSESSAGDGREWHNGCGCSVEEVFGTWAPDAREQRFVDAYDKVAEDIDGPITQDAVLPELRKLGFR